LRPVAGDASSRRYFRFEHNAQTYVVVDAPPGTEKNDEFLAVQRLLCAAGVRVPALLGAGLEQGFLLLEDLGDRLLLPELDDDSVDDYYRSASDLLLHLAQIDCAGTGLPVYDRVLLEEELGRVPEWFVAGLLGHEPVEAERALCAAVAEKLVASALEQPRVLVHRDFHSRNLMLVDTGELALIDFQDAVCGPVTYDPVSLLRDCYIRWPRERVRQWALDYRRRLESAGLLRGVPEVQYLRWFDWMGLQRHIKVLGTFARLYLRDGKSGYLRDLPLVIAYVLEVLRAYGGQEPLFAEMEAWFGDVLGPRIARQDWSKMT
jgi:aminoglycoside/choline kinase family phosphotransferase